MSEFVDDEEHEFAEGEEYEPDDEELEEIDEKIAEAEAFFDKWTEYMEYIRIEFDTEKNTATVVKTNRR